MQKEQQQTMHQFFVNKPFPGYRFDFHYMPAGNKQS